MYRRHARVRVHASGAKEAALSTDDDARTNLKVFTTSSSNDYKSLELVVSGYRTFMRGPYWPSPRQLSTKVSPTCIRLSMARSFATATVSPSGSKLACTTHPQSRRQHSCPVNYPCTKARTLAHACIQLQSRHPWQHGQTSS